MNDHQLYVHDHRLTMGELTVKVLKCSRLPQIDGVSKIYCTVGIGEFLNIVPLQLVMSKCSILVSCHSMETNDSFMENTMASS